MFATESYGVCQSVGARYRVCVIRLPTPEWPENPALFLDLDGTLLEFELEPSAVQVSDRLNSILEKLPGATSDAIAFVSGRTLADLDRLLGPGRFPLAAVHGLERRDAAGRRTLAETNADDIERIHTQFQEIAREYPDTLVEHKGISLALHYRKRPDLERVLVERVDAVLADIESEVKLMRGNMVLEVKATHGDKGSAISSFMQEPPFAGRTPVFVGDDVTDEDGFRVVNALGGISVKVNSGKSVAQYRLPDTEAVMQWLEVLVGEE